MASYTRQSTFSDGDLITAELFNDEYNQLLAAFENTTGHKHDGTVGEGPVISIIGDAGLTIPLNKILIDTTNDHIEFWVDVSGTSTQQLYITDGAILPVTDNDIDLGSNSLQFKDLYINGTANIDTVDIDAGTIDGVTIGGSSAGAITGTTITATNFVIGSASINETELEILDGATLTTTELNYVDGVTSSIQTQIDTKAPLASPSLTGIPTAPTAASNTNTTQIATTAYVQSELTDLIDGAPGTLDTLNELAAAINDDANYNTTLTTALATKLPLAGGTMTGNVTYSDNVKAQFGTSQDLQIYHDVSNSIIKDAGAGNLELHATNLVFKNSAGDSQYASFFDGGAVTLRYAGSPKVSTTSTGIDVTGVITTDGLTTSADINFGDNDKALFGAGNDLQIYHDGSNSYIKENGTGALNIAGQGNINFTNSSGSETYAQFTSNSSVKLYHDNAIKLTTTSTGIDVTGTVVSDGLTLGANDKIQFGTSDITGIYRTNSGSDFTMQHWGNLSMLIDSDNNDSGTRQFMIGRNSQDASTATKIALFSEGGDISFYEDTGTTAKFFWDASAESLGIGTTSPALQSGGNGIHVNGTSYSEIKFTNSTTGTASTDGTALVTVGTNFTINNRENGYFSLNTNNSEALRVDSSQRVGIGTTSPSATLEVATSATTNIDVAHFSNSNGAVKAKFHLAASTGDGQLTLYDGNNNADVLISSVGHSYLNSGGNLGIGTNTPSSTLDVNGTITYGSLSDGTITIEGFVDEDNMSSNSATLVPTQQSVKAYVDSQVSSAGGNGISFEDNEKAQFGDSNDLQIFHNGTKSVIQNAVGHLEINNNADDSDILFKSDNGSGGLTTYFMLDGGLGYSRAIKNIRFDDSVKATFGSSNDLQIYHDGSHSYIDEQGIGRLFIRASSHITLQNAAGTETYANFAENGAVGLRYNNATKLTTTSSGIDVTGTITSDALTVSNGTNTTSIPTTSDRVAFTGASLNYVQSAGNLFIQPTGDLTLNGSGSEIMRLKDGKVGIGTTSPAAKLDVRAANGNEISLNIGRSDTGSYFKVNHAGDDLRIYNTGGSGKDILFGVDAAGTNQNNKVGIGTASPDAPLTVHNSSDPEIRFGYSSTQDHKIAWDSSKVFIHADPENANGSSALGFSVDGSERARIDSSGNFGIGTSSPVKFLDVGANTNATAIDANIRLNTHYGTQNTARGGIQMFDGSGVTGQIDTRYDGNKVNMHFGSLYSGGYNTTSRMVITGDGKVGIGTASPSTALHVSAGDGSAELTVARTGTYASSWSLKPYNADFYIRESGSDRVTFKAGGSVGIGITSPTSPLTVKSNSTSSQDAGFTLQANGSTNAIFKVGEKADGKARLHMFDGTTEKIALHTDGTASHISAGNFGIGTNSPSSALEVNNASAGATVATFEGTYSGSGDVKLASFERSGGAVAAAMEYNDATTDMEFGTTTSHNFSLKTADTRRLTISSGGSVGIGLTNPSAYGKFVINGTSNQLAIRASSGKSRIALFEGGTGRFYIDTLNGSDGLAFVDADGSSERMRIDSSGNLLVGTTDSSPYNNSANTSADNGIALGNAGNVYAARYNFAPLDLNRTGSDGDVIALRKSGAIVGSIGTVASNIYLGTGDTGIYFNASEDKIYPINTSTIAGRDNAIDLGKSDTRFKDLYLSGTINSTKYDIHNEGGGSLYQTDGYIRFANGNTETIRIDSSGKVGIGETSPDSKLHVNAGGSDMVAKFESTDAGSYINIVDSGSGSYGAMIGVISDDIVLSPNNVEAVRIDNSGNVGIGTTSPAAKLEVNGGALKVTNAGNASIFINANAVGSDASIFFEEDDGVKAKIQHDASNDSMLFTDGAFTDTMTLKGAKVGIGTTNPTESLHTTGNIRLGDSAPAEIYTNSSELRLGVDRNNDNGTSNVTFYTNNDEKVRIDANGNVGIGTDSPARTLHIKDAVAGIRLEDSDGTSYGEIIYNEGSNGLLIRSDENNADSGSNIIFEVDGGEKARIDSSGNLLVGKTSAGIANVGVESRQNGLLFATADGSDVLKLNRLTSDGAVLELRKDGSTGGVIGVQEPQDSAHELYIANGTGTSNTGLAFWDYTSPVRRIAPCNGAGTYADNSIDLGWSSARFDDIYATNGTIQTSDRNDKQDIQALTAAETRVATACKGLLRRFRWQDAVTEKGDEARYHFGIISQDLQDAFTAEGLDAGDYGMFISETWEDSNGVEQTRLGVRYSELLAFIIAAI